MAHQPHTEILHHSTPTATLSHYVRLDRYLFQQPLHVKVLQADFPLCSSCTSTKSDRWRHNAHLSMSWEACNTAAASNAAVSAACDTAASFNAADSASGTLRPQRITQARRKRARNTTTSTLVTSLYFEGSAIIGTYRRPIPAASPCHARTPDQIQGWPTELVQHQSRPGKPWRAVRRPLPPAPMQQRHVVTHHGRQRKCSRPYCRSLLLHTGFVPQDRRTKLESAMLAARECAVPSTTHMKLTFVFACSVSALRSARHCDWWPANNPICEAADSCRASTCQPNRVKNTTITFEKFDQTSACELPYPLVPSTVQR